MQMYVRVVIIGGGVIGCSVFYYFIKLGWSDVVLFECKELIVGLIWYVVGGFYMINGNVNILWLQVYICGIYKEIQVFFEQDVGVYYVGGLLVVVMQICWDFLCVEYVWYKVFGFYLELIGLEEVKCMCLIMDVSDVLGVIYDLVEGYFDFFGVIYVYVKVVWM